MSPLTSRTPSSPSSNQTRTTAWCVWSKLKCSICFWINLATIGVEAVTLLAWSPKLSISRGWMSTVNSARFHPIVRTP